MLQLNDSRTGTDVTVRRSAAAIRIAVTGPPHDHPAGLSELRVCLTADLIRRILEDLHGVQVFVAVARDYPSGTLPSPTDDTLHRDLEELWIQPPASVPGWVDDVSALLAGPIDLVVEGKHERAGHAQRPPDAVLISVGAHGYLSGGDAALAGAVADSVDVSHLALSPAGLARAC
jgi:hypothetical protein